MSHHACRVGYGGRPLGEHVRTYPTARRIAADLRRDAALLGLRTRALAPAICAKYRVSQSTAMAAVGMARRGQ